MSESQIPRDPANLNHDELLSALFAQLVMQQSNMALMLLGKVAHPETGQVIKDLEAAKLFIDTVEMLEAKTKGNLSSEESALLRQSLMNLRLAYVEAAEAPGPQPAPAEPTRKAEPAPAAPPEEEHHKKFTKKY